MVNRDQVEEIVRSVLAHQFENIDIFSITVTPDFDEDGDKILIVQVVFDGDRKTLDARKASGLVRHVLPKIEEFSEGAFPVFSFIAKSELGNINSETA